jgi:hypothetical protein
MYNDPEPLLNIDTPSSLRTLTPRISLAPYYKKILKAYLLNPNKYNRDDLTYYP